MSESPTEKQCDLLVAPFSYKGTLTGPMLKVEWAKRHTQQLEASIKTFLNGNPYQFIGEVDSKTGENVLRVRVEKSLPIELSAIIGDIVHNLRSALDQLICDLIRDNRRQVRRNSGFPIETSIRAFEKTSRKMQGVSDKTERLVKRLKPYKGGNTPLWMLHELDALDKHHGIIPVAVAHTQTVVRTTIPFFHIGPDGKGFAIGSSPPGWKPLIDFQGVPAGFKPNYTLTDNAEIYRGKPFPFGQQIGFAVGIAFGQTKATGAGEPLVETIKQLTKFIERTIGIFERRCVKKRT